MDTINIYRKILTIFFEERAAIQNEQDNGLQAQLLINEAKTNFLLLKMGWKNKLFVHTVTFHMELKEGKVWIYENKTDVDLTGVLVDRGVDGRDVVLGYLSPALRALQRFDDVSSVEA